MRERVYNIIDCQKGAVKNVVTCFNPLRWKYRIIYKQLLSRGFEKCYRKKSITHSLRNLYREMIIKYFPVLYFQFLFLFSR